MPRPTLRLSCVHRPGRTLPARRRDRLIDEIRQVADHCFDTLPDYQVMRGDPQTLDQVVLSLARDADGRLLGFCSARLLPVDGVGEVFHLGLTCVHPDARGMGLTHRLLSRVVAHHLVLHRPWSGAWFSSAASVLSSLGNIALYFEQVHPSPFRATPPSETHLRIARAIATDHRAELHLATEALFCERRFVFEGGNAGTVFQKDATDSRYHHRDPVLTRWYDALCDLDAGDAVLQVGRFSLPGFARYAARSVGRKVPGVRLLLPAPTPMPVLGGPGRA